MYRSTQQNSGMVGGDDASYKKEGTLRGSRRCTRNTAKALEEGKLRRQNSNVSASSVSTAGQKLVGSSVYLSLKELPYGNFLLFKIWNYDPTPEFVKTLLSSLSVAGLVYMVFCCYIMTDIVGLDGSWDEHHGFARNSFWVFPEILAVALGIPLEQLYNLAAASYGLYVLIIIADVVLGATDGPVNDVRTHPWPASWHTDNTLCYHDMFCEPTRWGRLMRRPGNTLSNVNYLLCASLVFLSTFAGAQQNVFWMADTLFATMLFLLAIFSNLWHASNAPWTQYVDLWAMDSSILYLIVRYLSCGAIPVLLKYVTTNRAFAQNLAGTGCVAVYGVIVAELAKLQWSLYRSKWLHSTCPLSARSRLIGKSDYFGEGQIDCHITTVCNFAVFPVYYTIIPTLVQAFLIGSIGSVTAANWAFGTLLIGWTYRLYDRWVLDGCVFMNYFLASDKPTLFHTIGTSIFSPTAWLHFFTGITLIAAYAHARSLEGYV